MVPMVNKFKIIDLSTRSKVILVIQSAGDILPITRWFSAEFGGGFGGAECAASSHLALGSISQG